ncbi:hypothetical protein F0562_001065 [Nyssa sinensis]|uniref:Uncharacterized protein n=1 Tax=Nyssa sinensis TaxID=561372 RepID=A0A5J5C6X7_9ASTE|nr:hypothetical protein F0562_001065 [Nyssa sinensis]
MLLPNKALLQNCDQVEISTILQSNGPTVRAMALMDQLELKKLRPYSGGFGRFGYCSSFENHCISIRRGGICVDFLPFGSPATQFQTHHYRFLQYAFFRHARFHLLIWVKAAVLLPYFA